MLRRDGLRAEYGMFRVPTSDAEVDGDLIELDPRVQQMSTDELLEIVERQARALRKLESRNRTSTMSFTFASQDANLTDFLVGSHGRKLDRRRHTESPV